MIGLITPALPRRPSLLGGVAPRLGRHEGERAYRDQKCLRESQQSADGDPRSAPVPLLSRCGPRGTGADSSGVSTPCRLIDPMSAPVGRHRTIARAADRC